MEFKSIYFLLFLSSLSNAFTHLDLEELSSVDYGITILSTPMILQESPSTHAVILTSIYGQDYQCIIPDHSKSEEMKKEKEKKAVEIGIPDLLKPMESSPCLVYTKDWWTYEFCYGKYVKQYHIHMNKVSGEVTFLGYYESEYNWNNGTQNKSKTRLEKYHSQRYVNGTSCDLTDKPREAEIRFKCDDNGGDHISQITEPESCIYIITVNTNKVCHHPYLRPPVSKNEANIKCNPVLSQEEMDEYLIVEIETKEQTEQLSVQKKSTKEMEDDSFSSNERSAESEDSSKADDSETFEIVDNDLSLLDEQNSMSLKKIFTDALTESIQEVIGENEELADILTEGKDVKDIIDSGKIDEVIKKFLEDTPEKSSNSKSSDKLSSKDGKNVEDDKKSESDVISIQLLDEESFAELKNVPEEVTGFDFKNKKLLVRTQKNGLRQWVEYDRKGEEKIIHEDLSSNEDVDSEMKSFDEKVSSYGTLNGKNKVLSTDSDVDIQIGVAEISLKEDDGSSKDSEDDDSETDMQKQIKKALGEAELNKSGKKFEIKIITRGYYSKEDNSFHLIDGDKNSAFDSIIISLLNSDSKSSQEMKSQKELQDNYEFVWNKKNKIKN